MTEMSPEPMPLRVTTKPQTLVEVEGPDGLSATVTIPDQDGALDALAGFILSLPYAVQRGLGEAEAQASVSGDDSGTLPFGKPFGQAPDA